MRMLVGLLLMMLMLEKSRAAKVEMGMAHLVTIYLTIDMLMMHEIVGGIYL
jgi:hypothetical protein